MVHMRIAKAEGNNILLLKGQAFYAYMLAWTIEMLLPVFFCLLCVELPALEKLATLAMDMRIRCWCEEHQTQLMPCSVHLKMDDGLIIGASFYSSSDSEHAVSFQAGEQQQQGGEKQAVKSVMWIMKEAEQAIQHVGRKGAATRNCSNVMCWHSLQNEAWALDRQKKRNRVWTQDTPQKECLIKMIYGLPDLPMYLESKPVSKKCCPCAYEVQTKPDCRGKKKTQSFFI